MSGVATAGYSVARAIGKCQICARPVAPGEKLMAALLQKEALLERLDICSACWPAFDKSPLLGFWQTTMPTHEAKKHVFVDDEVLCELFERLADTTEPAKINFRFVLGLILMRKRRLAYESTRIENGTEIWSMRLRGKEQTLDMINPKLDEQQVTEVSGQLNGILSGDEG